MSESWIIALLGEGRIGKTVLRVRFVLQLFIEDYDDTYDTETGYRRQVAVDDRMCEVIFIDLDGQFEERAALRDNWIRAGQGFVLMYSITSRESFDAVRASCQSVQRIKGENPIMMLVGTKYDKSFERTVSTEEGVALAKELGCEFFETSAKTGQNVERAMKSLVQSLREARTPASTPGPGSVGERKKKKSRCIIL
ncbi:ras protein [Mycena maculata]|uniref:Ras protein n=1 Tax=Mycena maculata TaxID=230809 RepID=A0AAD7I820_9AGAR|nr:ras protein [Mycena maculata]